MGKKELFSSGEQNYKSKWLIAILLLLFIPPLGLYYIWKEKQFFYKKFHLVLWISGGWILTLSLIILTIWLPDAKKNFEDMGMEKGLSIISYLDIILPIIILFSILQIIFGFAFNGKINSSSAFPKKYITVAMIFLFVTLVVVPIIIISVSMSANMSFYEALGPGTY